MKKTIQKYQKTKAQFLKKLNEIDKSLAKIKKKEDTNKIRDEKRETL